MNPNQLCLCTILGVLLYLTWTRRRLMIDYFVPAENAFPTIQMIDHPKYQAKMRCFANPDDTVCSKILKGEIWEEKLFNESIKPYIHPNTTVLDCGSYVGSHSVLISKLDPSVDVIAFEMMPEHYKLVQDNIRINHLSNVIAFNCALSDKNGKIPIPEVDYQKKENVNYGATQLADAKSSEHPIHIASITLDSFLPWIVKPLTFIKMDVEGHEIPALRGALQMLTKYRPIILLEVWETQYDAFQQSDVWLYLSQNLGYRMDRIDGADFILRPK